VVYAKTMLERLKVVLVRRDVKVWVFASKFWRRVRLSLAIFEIRIRFSNSSRVLMAGPLGFEPRISGSAGQCPNPY
jgi:hypothetical protein